MSLRQVFETLRPRHELALMPYVMAGYPTLDRSLELLSVVAANGADIIELGVPFSDPVADGATIESAAHVALAGGFRLRPFLQQLALQRLPKPIVLMSYLNPLLAYGREQVLDDARSAGISGLIVPDLPPEESGDWRRAASEHDMDLVLLVAPTCTEERIRTVADATNGFLYAVSIAGTTGARAELDRNLIAYLARLRRLTNKPIAVGFGISQPDHVRALRGHADGVIIGSRLVQALQDGEDIPALIQSFKRATKE